MKDPRTIVITGASSGLGEGLAVAYAKEGVTLLLTGRNAERLSEVAARCRGKGATVEERVIDVADRMAMDEMLVAFDDTHPIDLLIANAGVGHGVGRFVMEKPEQTQDLVDINVLGVTNTVMPLVERFAARGRGQIAVLASIAGFAAMPASPTYAATKAFVKSWGEGLHGRMKPFGVEVTTICPGFVKSPMTDVNKFPMPFLMESDRAVDIMVRGLESGRARVAFPWQMTWAAGFLGALPSFVANKITALKKKPKLRSQPQD